ncbi:hypothetical protein [Flagellimonas allohymeniacidonis]|uniref:hypothetical protein n=1 Tax=Flagellimonas allohymeniacidonis TaxID=2517819 RepID=UPI0013EE4EE2|nr:hypothetical protein [Allomuricauda hymeniacidonis]
MLRYLEKLEIGLSSFSYEELTTSQAGELKKSFTDFKNDLENKVFGVPPLNELDAIFEEVGISSLPKESSSKTATHKSLKPIFVLLQQLESISIDKKQQELLSRLTEQIYFAFTQLSTPDLSENTNQIERRLQVQRRSKVDLCTLWEECMQQMDLLEEFVRLYKQNVLEFIGKIRINLQSQNYQGIDFSCQKLGSSLRMLKTLSLLEITEQMSLECKNDHDIKHLKFLYGQFLVEYPKVEELLDLELEMLRKKSK